MESAPVAIHARGSVVRHDDLPPEIRTSRAVDPELDSSERSRILAALDRAGGNRTFAAALLGISRATLYRRLASLDIPPSWRSFPSHDVSSVSRLVALRHSETLHCLIAS